VVAQVLAEHARSSDQVARYGGEEFVVVLPDTPPELAGSIAQRLCAVIRDTPLRLPDGDLLTLTASIGVHACVPATGTRWQVLLDAADAAMYEAKRCGRDRVALSAT
jgi:two-component system cell cycle response regulator